MIPCIVVPCMQFPTKDYYSLKISSAGGGGLHNTFPNKLDDIHVSALNVSPMRIHELLRNMSKNHSTYAKYEFSHEQYISDTDRPKYRLASVNSHKNNNVAVGPEIENLNLKAEPGSLVCPTCQDKVGGLKYCQVCGSELVLALADDDDEIQQKSK